MPEINVVLPHWLYWAGLIVFPFIAAYLVQRQRRRGAPRRASYFIAYLLWLVSGFVGLHRFYLRSALGLVFVALFGAVLYCNQQVRDLREDVSRTHAEMERARQTLQRAAERSAPADAAAAERLRRLEADAAGRDASARAARVELGRWHDYSRWLALAIAALLLADAAMIPALVRRVPAAGEAVRPAAVEVAPPVHEGGTGEDPGLAIHTRVTDALEWLNVRAGELVAYWAVIAVFVYYYEVVARYVFNSPTNWVHESMFLMFGMQYMISGAYAYREDQHVRVDILYARLGARGRAWADIFTSVFFFIFTGTMLWTGARFAMDAIRVGEVSFTEWGIQYWPVKLMIPIGAGLMVLQGVSKLIKDVVLIARREA